MNRRSKFGMVSSVDSNYIDLTTLWERFLLWFRIPVWVSFLLIIMLMMAISGACTAVSRWQVQREKRQEKEAMALFLENFHREAGDADSVNQYVADDVTDIAAKITLVNQLALEKAGQ